MPSIVSEDLFFLLPVAVSQVFSEETEESVSVVEVTTIKQKVKILETVVEDVETKPQLREQQEVVLPQAKRETVDDWFVLLDVVPREISYVPPGIVSSPCQS